MNSEAEKLSEVFGVSLTEMESGISANYEKYKQMILACIRNAGSKKDGRITKTKLAKLVYLADFAWFYNHLESTRIRGIVADREYLSKIGSNENSDQILQLKQDIAQNGFYIPIYDRESSVLLFTPQEYEKMRIEALEKNLSQEHVAEGIL